MGEAAGGALVVAVLVLGMAGVSGGMGGLGSEGRFAIAAKRGHGTLASIRHFVVCLYRGAEDMV